MPDARSWTARNADHAGLVQTVKTIYTASCRLKRRRSFDEARFVAPRTETHQDIHREQSERPSQRPSPRRLACMRPRRFAGPWRPADGAGDQALRVRGSTRSGRQPRLTTRLPRSEFQRPGSRKGSGPFRLSSRFSFHFGCALALRRRKTSRCTRRGMCVAGRPASCSETPPPTGGLARGHSRSGSLQVVFVQLARTPEFHSGYAGSTPAHGTNNPKSRRRSRRATQTGRNDWAAPEPVTGIFSYCLVNSEEECSPVQRAVPGSSPARGASCRALGGGRSSMAEPRVVIPLTLVRFRSAHPQAHFHHPTRRTS